MKKPSLALIPSGYKAGKVYSILPNNSVGDFTFIRNSGATRVNKNGLIENVGETIGSEEVTNGYFDTDTDWTKQNGSTISGGVATVIANGSVGASGGNRGVQQDNVFVAGNTYDITFTVRQTVGSGIFQISNGFTLLFDTTVTSEFTTYTVRRIAGAVNLQDHIIGIGGRTVSDEFELTYISVKEVLTEVNIPRLDYSEAGCPSLLLEPQRTNLITYSEDFSNASWVKTNCTINSNNAISPNGTQNADKLDFTTSNGEILSVTTFVSGQEYTMSFYAKTESGTLDFTYGNMAYTSVSGTATTEWQRFELTQTLPTSVRYPKIQTTEIGSLLLWGFQIEQGSYATSYIPTTNGSIATRIWERCVDSGNADLFNDDEGVLYLETKGLFTALNGYITLYDGAIGSYTNHILFQYRTDGNFRVWVGGLSGSNINFLISNIDLSENHKIAFQYQSLTDNKLFIDGVEQTKYAPFTPTTLSGLNRFDFTINNNNSLAWEGRVKDLRYYDTLLTDAELQELTTL